MSTGTFVATRAGFGFERPAEGQTKLAYGDANVEALKTCGVAGALCLPQWCDGHKISTL